MRDSILLILNSQIAIERERFLVGLDVCGGAISLQASSSGSRGKSTSICLSGILSGRPRQIAIVRSSE